MYWFGFQVFFLASYIFGIENWGNFDPWFVILPLAMIAIGIIALPRMVRGRVDEVSDDGEYLIARKGGKKHRISLSQISNLSISDMSRQITIHLREEGPLGKEIVFTAKSKLNLNPWRRPAIYEELVKRVDSARTS